MQIKLDFITGQDTEGEDIVITKTFVAINPKSRLIRKAIALVKELDFTKDIEEVEDLDKLVNYVCEVYNNKFTIDELYDGLGASQLVPTLLKTIGDVKNGVEDRLATFPQN
jgi:hypothetical protein